MNPTWRYVCCAGWLLAAAARGADLASLGYPADAVATDAAGNAYLAGSTRSLTLAVKNAYQPRPGESQFLKSEDRGATWTRAGVLPSDPPTALAADPATPGLLYAGGLDGIHKSTDGGLTWRLALAGPVPSYPGVVHIAVDPAEPRRVFALAWFAGLLRSEDQGESWSTVISERGASPLDRIVIDPHGSGTVLATIIFPRISRDAGRTWEPLPGPAGVGFPRLAAFDPHHPGWMYLSIAAGTLGQLYLSTDYGKTWRARPSPPGAIYEDLVLDPQRPDVLYAATLNGFARSEDGALTWKSGGDTRGVQRLAAPAKDCGPPGTLLATAGQFALRSVDGGDTWTDLGISGVTAVASGAGCSIWLARAVASEGFVTKVSPEGETVWATFLGGSGQDTLRRIAVDAPGNVTVAGVTSSPDFPGTVHGARRFDDVFVARFDRDGALVYSVALGGSAPEELRSLSVDADGTVLIAGLTRSPDFPFTSSDPPPQAGGFVAKLGPSGSLMYAVPIPAVPFAPVVAAAPAGQAWVGTSEGQLLRLDAGGTIVNSRRLCENCAVHALAADAEGSLYVAGSTADPAFTVTPGTYQTGVRSAFCTLGGGRFGVQAGDLFLMKFEPSESEPAFTALIGADCNITPDALLVDQQGRITVSAQTLAAAFPLRRPLIGSPLPGNYTGAVMQLSPAAHDLLFSTYWEASAAPGIAPGPGESLYIGSKLVSLAPATGPRLDSVLHAFRGSATVAPGGLLTLIGAGIGPEEWIDLGLNALQRLPYELGGTAVHFDGRPASMLSAGSDLVVCVAPAGLQTSTVVEVYHQGVRSNPVLMRTSQIAGLLTRTFPSQPPHPDGVVRNEDGALNDAEHPARPGSRITVFFTGLPRGPSSLEPGSIAADDSAAGQVWGLWQGIGRTPASPARLVPGFVSALQQAQFQAPPSGSGRMVFQIYSFNPDFVPRAAPDSNPIGIWVR